MIMSHLEFILLLGKLYYVWKNHLNKKKQFIPNSAYCLLTNKTVDFVLLILKYVI